jgi:ABC-2 type transport system ATP-binding protein
LWAIKANEMFKLLNAIKENPAVENCYPFGQYHHVVFKTLEDSRQKLADITGQGDYTNVEILLIEPNIEDCFMALMTN